MLDEDYPQLLDRHAKLKIIYISLAQDYHEVMHQIAKNLGSKLHAKPFDQCEDGKCKSIKENYQRIQ